VMNKDKWNQLPVDVQKAIDGLSRDQAVWTAEYVDQHVKDALAWSKEKYKHEVFVLPPADQEKVRQLLKPMTDEYIQKAGKAGLNGEQIIKDVSDLKARHAQPSPKPKVK
jgi:TRAP-type transport system periplasmic protein